MEHVCDCFCSPINIFFSEPFISECVWMEKPSKPYNNSNRENRTNIDFYHYGYHQFSFLLFILNSQSGHTFIVAPFIYIYIKTPTICIIISFIFGVWVNSFFFCSLSCASLLSLSFTQQFLIIDINIFVEFFLRPSMHSYVLMYMYVGTTSVTMSAFEVAKWIDRDGYFYLDVNRLIKCLQDIAIVML